METSLEAPSQSTASPKDEPDDDVPNVGLFQWAGTGKVPPADDTASPSAEENEESAVAQGTKAATPMQKRRRVTRACDECRRKKIKCDGRQPCTHCTVYSYGQYSAEDLYGPD